MGKVYLNSGKPEKTMQEPQLTETAQRRQYPRERNGRKNEWKAVVTHLEEMNNVLNQAERNVKEVKTHELQGSYDDKLRQHQEELQRQLEAKQRDHEEMILRKALYDQDVARSKEDKHNLQGTLANNYSAMMEHRYREDNEKRQQSIVEGIRMIEDAQRSLEAERRMKKEKLDNYQREAKVVVDEKEYRKLTERERAELEKGEYRDQIQAYAQKEMLREANYKNFFKQVALSQEQRQQLHNEKVLAQVSDRIRTIEEIIAKNEQQYNRKKLEEELSRMRKHKEDLLNTADVIKNQMATKEHYREEERVAHQRRVEESQKLTQEYFDHLAYQKLEKKDQQSFYKDYLDKQKHDKDEKLVKTNAMARPEKDLNKDVLHAFKEGRNEVTALIPGFSNSKYIHPYSPEARYAQVLQHKKQGGTMNTLRQSGNGFPEKQTNHDNIFRPEGNTYSNSVAQLGGGRTVSLQQTNDNLVAASPGTRTIAAVASPVSNPHVSPSTYHNPITNPIPGTIQNPYILKELRKSQNTQGRSLLAQVASDNIIN
eukprot:TRINITY_DN2003_c0_g2_i1.p1 TRINITY_DN2003_c0_g2~~TRINITY_DN2003_c0_g2_i1.p1  ORF type:complete len:553 (-),score=180.62 TRINITY_DN2003_c0_g2_i1:128-1747(-)